MVGGERDDDDSRIFARGSIEYGERVVGATVIDEKNLVGAAWNLIEHRAEAGEELWDVDGLVVVGDRNGKARPVFHSLLRPLK